mmetsp:Transcript_22431/g.52400  ORF Transcript_22431/g.52400 Transcript_22431/m.52400 type:complete len:205 (+) Transcript_22431:309-923(+)
MPTLNCGGWKARSMTDTARASGVMTATSSGSACGRIGTGGCTPSSCSTPALQSANGGLMTRPSRWTRRGTRRIWTNGVTSTPQRRIRTGCVRRQTSRSWSRFSGRVRSMRSATSGRAKRLWSRFRFLVRNQLRGRSSVALWVVLGTSWLSCASNRTSAPSSTSSCVLPKAGLETSKCLTPLVLESGRHLDQTLQPSSHCHWTPG